MALTFPPQGSPHWMRRVEQALLQNHVDIQRLWQIVPQIPDQVPGIPFTGPLSPTWFVRPSSTSSARSRSSHNSSAASGASSSSAAGSSSSAAASSTSSTSSSSSHNCSLDICFYVWTENPPGSGQYFWNPFGEPQTTCKDSNGCNCTEPSGVGAFNGEEREGTCGRKGASSASSSSSSRSASSAPCGDCLIEYIGGAWMTMSNNCIDPGPGSDCVCYHPPESSFEGDIRTTNCIEVAP